MTIKIRTKNELRFGQRITLFAAGTVEISKEGTFEVDTEEIAKDVEETYHPEFFIDGKQSESTTMTTETTTQKPEELNKKAEEDELNKNTGNDIGGDNEKELLIKQIDSSAMDELTELAKPFRKKDWDKMDEAQLKAYLKSKLA